MGATAKIAASVVLSAANNIKERAIISASDKRGEWLERALATPVRRGWLWWAYEHYRTEAECLVDYRADRGWEGSIENGHNRRADIYIERAEKYIDLANASLTSGDRFVTLSAEDVQFLGLQRDEK